MRLCTLRLRPIYAAPSRGSSLGATGALMQGWALVEEGQAEEGVAQIRQGLAARRATGTELYRPWFLALLAEAYGKVWQAAEGLVVLAEALAVVDKTGERFWEAELHRLQGELTLQSRGSGLPSTVEAEAEQCFHQALAVARTQQAKSWELRAATSLARLWHRQGKQEAAQQLLGDIYGWFTEGFDTHDLRAAQALLEELR